MINTPFLQKVTLSDNFFLLDISLVFFLSCCFLFFNYLYFCHNAIDNCFHAKKVYQLQQLTLIANQLAHRTEKNNLKQLDTWKKKHPNFYGLVTPLSNVNQQLSFLTQLIEQSHLTINELSKINKLPHSQYDYSVKLTANGEFINLFSLITTLNHFAIPFTLSQLSLKQHQFNLVFILRSLHA